MSKEEEEAERIIRTYWVCDVGMTEKLAIKSAIIHVEGIMDEIQDMDWEFSTRIAAERLEYWQEVLTILINK